jgi:hypothetical protein
MLRRTIELPPMPAQPLSSHTSADRKREDDDRNHKPREHARIVRPRALAALGGYK